MRVFVVGANGQLAQSLIECGPRFGNTVIAMGRPTCDLTRREELERVIAEQNVDLVINAAAYTAVDLAEKEIDTARAINAKGPEILASVTAKRDLPLIHLSTDYVFDGQKKGAYRENDTVSPLGVYGRTKLDGEKAVLENNPYSLVLRTAWVYSPFGKNFLKTMLSLSETRDVVSVVADQIGSPTCALHIAEGIFSLAPLFVGEASAVGVRHMVGTGTASWAKFAEEIFAVSKALGGPSADVNPIPTSEYPTAAARPVNSVLDCSSLQKDFGVTLPNWQDGVAQCVKRLLQD